MFTIMDYSSALEYSIIRRYTNIVYYYGQSFFPKTISAWNGLAFAEAPSLAVFRSNFIIN